MKIAHFPGNFLPTLGGAEIASHNIVQNLSNLGNDVSVIVTDKRAHKLKSKFPEEISYEIISLLPKTLGILKKTNKLGINFGKLIYKQIDSLQRKYNFDVWHFNLAKEQALFTLPFLKENKIPSVVTCQGTDIQVLEEVSYGHRMDSWYNKLFEKNIILADHFTAISESVKDEYIKLGVLEKDICDIPNGVDFNKINSCISKENLRTKFGWPDNKKIILTVGRNHPKKGYIFIPEIVKELLKLRDDFLWVIVGRGCDNISKKSKDLGVGNWILCMNELGLNRKNKSTLNLPTEDLIMAYKSSDIFAFPTLIETFGTVQVEAMAAGLPVITTDAPGARDIVKHEENGLKSKVKDVLAMAVNIDRVLSDQGLYDRLSHNALNFSKEYSWLEIAKKYLKSFEIAINKTNNNG